MKDHLAPQVPRRSFQWLVPVDDCPREIPSWRCPKQRRSSEHARSSSSEERSSGKESSTNHLGDVHRRVADEDPIETLARFARLAEAITTKSFIREHLKANIIMKKLANLSLFQCVLVVVGPVAIRHLFTGFDTQTSRVHHIAN